MTKFYVGCGSSDTPEDVLCLIELLARVMSDKRILLRSSETGAADRAFIRGTLGMRYSFIPEDDPEKPTLWGVPSEAWPGSSSYAQARKLNPGFMMLPTIERQWEIVANTLVHGSSGTDIAKLLICWTPDGATMPAEFTSSTGHVARYLKVAHAAGVPVFNLQRPDHRKKFEAWI